MVLLHHMTHNPNRIAGLAVLEGDDDVVLPGFSAEEVYGVVLLLGVLVVT